MMIMLLIYTLVFSIIIYKGFYKSIPLMEPFSMRKNVESLSISIQLESLPFFFNQRKIYLFIFFINFILISFISLPLLSDLISNHIAYCQDSDSSSKKNSVYDSDSTVDSDHGKRITNYYGENDIYKININREEEIRREEESLLFIEHGRDNYYQNNYEGIYKKTIEETYRISDQKYPYIHFLNSFSNFRDNDNPIKINDYLKVFQGFSKDIEKIMENQNHLIQKIIPIDKHSFKIYRIRDMFSEISERSMDTLCLISFAYDTIMDSYTNSLNNLNSSNSSNSSLFEENNLLRHNSYSRDLLNKILNNKTNNNEDINENIGSFIEKNHQINTLNKKVSKIFNILEEIQKLSKENSNNLNELIVQQKTLKDLNLKINDDNISIIKKYEIPKENSIKTFKELYDYYKKFNEEDSDINWNKIGTILCNIQDFCKSKIFIKNPYQIKDTGFILNNINQYYDESSSDSDANYFGGESSDEDEIFNYNWEHTDIY